MWEHCQETELLKLANEKYLFKFIMSEGFLEVGGTTNKHDLSKLIMGKYSYLCYLPEVGELCRHHYDSAKSLEVSPSINLTYSDPDRLNVYLNMKAGTSVKFGYHQS